MATETLVDELLEIACGSANAGEVESRFQQLTMRHAAERKRLATEVTRSIQLLRIQAKGMETHALLKTSQRELERMNLGGWADETLGRASDLRREADELERVAVAAGVIDPPDRPKSLYGIWKGVEVTEEEIERAKRSLFKEAYDESI
ncbi:MAG: hypothetical protein KGK07_15440 [Chloroflexota bacterium]|nr:hypothetical protein [Chloroflexota bacterium]